MARKLLSIIVPVVLFLDFSAMSSFGYAHEARFSWRVEGGTVNPVQSVYDGENRIAVFECRTVEQPEENLRYFNSVPKPPVLRNLVLRPGGKTAR